MIERWFQDVADGKLDESAHETIALGFRFKAPINWDVLLRSPRVLIISEAGAGKTFECQARRQHLWAKGESAFYVELSALAATHEFRNLYDDEEKERLSTWHSSAFEVATFFVDSIDELKLTRFSLEFALKRLKSFIGARLVRTRIVITTRPTPFDQALIKRLFPVPNAPSLESKEEKFVTAAMGGKASKRETSKEDLAPEWRLVGLMPLSDAQIIEFARGQGVNNPNELLQDLQHRNAQDFASRPQDLIELCADWRVHNRIRTHLEQVKSNVRVKLEQRQDRQELAELSVNRATEGASRLALAMLVTRRFTIRHSAESDSGGDGATLNPLKILTDWQANERTTLLERPLFGFASYGRVRFHHRSVLEFLAAEHLIILRSQGMTFQALKRLLFA